MAEMALGEAGGAEATPLRVNSSGIAQPGVLLTIESVTLVSYGRVLVRDLVAQYGSGQSVEISGPNGSGKTTLLATLAGLRPPDSGFVRWATATSHAPTIHFGPQYPLLFGNLSVFENLALIAHRDSAAVLGALASDRSQPGVDALCDVISPMSQRAGVLSLGQQRALLMLAAYLSDADALMLDEPLAGLASGLSTRASQLLNSLENRGRLLIMTSPA